MTRYLSQKKLSPAEAKKVLRTKPEVLPRLPREIIFPKVDNGSYTPLRSNLSAKASRTAGQANACQKVQKVLFSTTQ